jgi:hypothetical protein
VALADVAGAPGRICLIDTTACGNEDPAAPTRRCAVHGENLLLALGMSVAGLARDRRRHTLCLGTAAVDRCTPDKDIMNHRENTFATDPGPIFVFDATVIQRGRLVVCDTLAMYLLGKWNLIWMEVFPA